MTTVESIRREKVIPQISDHFVELPLTRLHYIQCGGGPPLIMLPATVSEIGNWVGLAQFMGQYFTTYFFELPGHGQSAPFAEPFSSQLLAETLEDLLDALGHERASLMGFSFGGMLTLQTLLRLRHRIDRVVLISPSTSFRTLRFSSLRLFLLRRLVLLLKWAPAFNAVVRIAKSRAFSEALANAIARAGKVEDSIRLTERLRGLKVHTMSTLRNQMHEALFTDRIEFGEPLSLPCYFFMSINDPVIDYHGTLANLRGIFRHIEVTTFRHHYHQAPDHPTFHQLDAEYGPMMDELLGPSYPG